jgi:hypothetical protein
MSVLRRATAAALVLGGLLLGGAAPLRADHWHEECEHQIHRAEWRLRRAIERHGEGSPQAEHRRHELEEIRERCREARHEQREEHHEEHEEHEQVEHGY